jgi:chromosome segregation ATPase
MSKRIKKLEKENGTVRSKCETMNVNIIDMAHERAENQKQLALAAQREKKLENLCRSLQQERNQYRDKLVDLQTAPGCNSSDSGQSVRSFSRQSTDDDDFDAILASNKLSPDDTPGSS